MSEYCEKSQRKCSLIKNGVCYAGLCIYHPDIEYCELSGELCENRHNGLCRAGCCDFFTDEFLNSEDNDE